MAGPFVVCALSGRLRPVPHPTYKRPPGEVPEWPNGAVSKTVVPLWAPWVRIPPSPPAMKDFCGLWSNGAVRPLISPRLVVLR
jgi:hypothetical protein